MTDELVKIATASTQTEAEMWRGLLANAGIDCLVRNVGSLLAYTPVISPHEVFVRDADAAAARELLAAFSEPVADHNGQDTAK